eukprot:268573-Amphidinium_carterae.3
MLDAETLAHVVQAVLVVQRGATGERREGDMDVKTLRHPGEFSGREQDWRQWSFKWEAYCALLGIEDEMTETVLHPPERLRMEGQGAEQKARSRPLYHMRVTSVSGKAFLKVKLAEKGNGYDAWSCLKTNTSLNKEHEEPEC